VLREPCRTTTIHEQHPQPERVHPNARAHDGSSKIMMCKPCNQPEPLRRRSNSVPDNPISTNSPLRQQLYQALWSRLAYYISHRSHTPTLCAMFFTGINLHPGDYAPQYCEPSITTRPRSSIVQYREIPNVDVWPDTKYVND
jgi:hypothetical protein